MEIQWNAFLIEAINFLPRLIAAMVILVISVWAAAWLARVVQRMLARREAAEGLTDLFTRLTRWSVLGLGITMSLQQVGFDITAFLTGLGVLGFTVGFAVQDVSKNLMAGVLLMLQQPFTPGEVISVGGFSGTVEEVDLRATALRTFDGKLIYIPNTDVYTSAITNLSRSQKRRVQVDVGVAYGTDLARAKAIALQAVSALEGVQQEPAPTAVFHTFNDASVDMSIYFWTDTTVLGLWDAKDAAVRAIHTAFAEAGIDIPYPIHTVYLENTSSADA